MDYDTPTATRYIVALHDYPQLPVQQQIEAEVRYSRTLERLLGGPDTVVTVLEAVQHLADADGGEASEDDQHLAKSWNKAHEAARAAGLQGLGDVHEAYFEVRLAR